MSDDMQADRIREIAEAVMHGGQWYRPGNGQTIRDYGIECVAAGIEEGQRYIRDALAEDVRAALEGDSNDAEHDALYGVSVVLGIEFESPYEDDEDA